MAIANANLHKAKNAKNDEFYTQLTDIRLFFVTVMTQRGLHSGSIFI